MSAILPKGTKNTAADKRYEVLTQLKRTASMANSFPREGRAMLIDELMKGVKKEPTVATRRADLLVSMGIDFVGGNKSF